MSTSAEQDQPDPDSNGIAVVLGAGASRSVSYSQTRPVLSPLDTDFLGLLQQLDPKARDQDAVKWVINQAIGADARLWDSMERLFYTLHMRAMVGHRLYGQRLSGEDVEANFARAIQALLRSAHGKAICEHHTRLFRPLGSADTIVSFNYDLVPERALKKLHQDSTEFGPSLYALDGAFPTQQAFPCLLKLHGSSNWRKVGKDIQVPQECWEVFDNAPQYGRWSDEFPILLPFWDKKIERRPWLKIWKMCASRLRAAGTLIVWGYSLPVTDVKARELFRTALTLGSIKRVCVIDPSTESRLRWREIALKQQFWPFGSITEFFDRPPAWFRHLPTEAAGSSAG